MEELQTRQIVLTGVMIALVAVFTLAVRIPFPLTQGYFNFSDVGVYLAAFAFGPWVGLIAGGVGTALADTVGGYLIYAPISLITRGLQGLVAGAVARRDPGVASMVAGWALGSVVMVTGYFVSQAFILQMGIGPATAEALAINLPQVVIGGIVAVPLVLALRRGYPPIVSWGRPRV